MKETTSEYRNLMAQPMRNPSSVEITIERANQKAYNNGVYKVSSPAEYYVNNLDPSMLDANNFNAQVISRHNELGVCALGDAWRFATESEVKNASISEGIHSTVNTVDLIKTFNTPQKLTHITLFTALGGLQCTSSVTAWFYYADGTYKSVTLYHTNFPIVLTVPLADSPVSRFNCTIRMTGGRARSTSNSVFDCTQFPELLTSHPAVYADSGVILTRIVYGIEKKFTEKDIEKAEQSTDVDPLSRRLPKEEFQFTLLDFNRDYDFDNPSGVYQLVDEHAPVRVRYGIQSSTGGTQWVAPDNYTLSGKPTFANGRATFKATGLFGQDDTRVFYKCAFGKKTLYDLAVSVLEDMLATQETVTQVRYDIDVALKDMYTDGVLPVAPHKECLQLIAHAGLCTLYTDDANVIHISRFKQDELTPVDFTLDANNYMDKSQQASKIPLLKEIVVKQYSYAATETKDVLFDSVISDVRKHIDFDMSKNVEITVDGAPLATANVYASSADLLFGTSESKHVVLRGNKTTQQSVNYVLRVSDEGEQDTEENPLITSQELAQHLAEHTRNYLMLRKTYDQSYRGNPEIETRDVVTFAPKGQSTTSALILTDKITYNGALRGNLKVKVLEKGGV